MKRFDNITDAEIEEGIKEIERQEAQDPRVKKLIWGVIVLVLVLILIIGYDIAPNYSLAPREYLLDWLKR